MVKLIPQIIERLFCVSVLFAVCIPVHAEDIPKFKFGQITREELENNTCDIDTSAHAFFLFDCGTSNIDYSSITGFQIKYERHCAIKIITKAGYDYADFKIPVYRSSNSAMDEKVTRIKAVTYNLEGNKIEETSLNKKDIFNENENENWTNVSFSLPNVKEGSVIEVEYSITSDFLWNLPAWRFQYEIPSKWSILETRIPEFFNYNKEMKGYVGLLSHDSKTRNDKIVLVSADRSVNSAGFTVDNGIQRDQIDFLSNEEVYVAKNVPAFKEEPYIDAVENYISSIEFELQSTKFPNQMMKTYTTTWEEIAKLLMDDTSFGQQLGAVGNSKDIVKELNIDGLPEIEKAQKIFGYVKSSTKWNEKYSKYCENVRQVIKNGVGSSGEINIVLINMLDAAGLNVNPVVLKTRYAGKLPIVHPSLSSLNYVIAAVNIDGKTILLDATEKEMPFGFLPERCLNEKGILITKDKKIEWVGLNENVSSKYNVYGILELTDNGEIKASLNHKRDGYLAFERRKELDYDKDEIIKNLEKENAGLLVEAYEINKLKEYEDILEEKIDGTITENVTVAGDMIYFNPCIFERYEENPFKIEERKYPVDFAFPWENKIIYSITLPEGWGVESLPENLSIKLPDNAGRYIYGIQQLGNKLLISQSFQILKSLLLPEQYSTMKEFFRQMVDKQQEQIVLKRI